MSAFDRSEVTDLLRVLPELYPGGDRWLAARLTDIHAGQAFGLVGILDGHVAGVAIVTPKRPLVNKLSTLYVAEWARRAGVGSNLIDRVTERFALAPGSELYVTVAHHLSQPLIGLLGPRGFIERAFEENRYGLGRHEIVLSRLTS